MCILGHLSSHNPAFVMPTLRNVLIQSGVQWGREAEYQTAEAFHGQYPQDGPAILGPHSEGTNDPTEGTPPTRTPK